MEGLYKLLLLKDAQTNSQRWWQDASNASHKHSGKFTRYKHKTKCGQTQGLLDSFFNWKLGSYNYICHDIIFSCFGPKGIAVKPLAKLFQELLEHKDRIVREDGKRLIVEVYRWIGPPIKPQLAALKPVQVMIKLHKLKISVMDAESYTMN